MLIFHTTWKTWFWAILAPKPQGKIFFQKFQHRDFALYIYRDVFYYVPRHDVYVSTWRSMPV